MKRNQFGIKHHPGKVYRAFKQNGGTNKGWKQAQRRFKRRKRKNKISRLARKCRPVKRTLRPKL